MRRLAVLAIALAGAALSGCTMVGAERPLFTAADAGGVRLKPGLWALINPVADTCNVPKTRRIGRWDDCARPFLVGDQFIIALGKSEEGVGPGREIPFQVVAGDPVILQLEAPDDKGPAHSRYAFVAVYPTKAGDNPVRRGVVAFVQCPGAADAPIADLKTVGQNCVASTPKAVRDAAAAQDAAGFPAVWIARDADTR
jgi:hypothetical protein